MSEGALACLGGTPVRRQPFAVWPVYDDATIEAVGTVLRSGRANYWTGDEGTQFEREFAAFVDCDHAIALANGTVALETALYAVGVGPGDEVIVPCRTFVGSATSIVARGARPVFADVDPSSGNITADTARTRMTPRTKAIIAVHLAGWPCEMDPIMDLARRHGISVVEDCAQAHGATYRGRRAGSLGHAAAFSFCQDKIISTGGEGGMMTTGDPELWNRAWSYKDHGKSYEAVFKREHSTIFKWTCESFGTNARMTEMQAAIGRVMLREMSRMLARRQRNAEVLANRLSDWLLIPQPPAHVEHAWYKCYAYLRGGSLRPGWDRDRLIRAIQAEGVPCGSGICGEVYREEAFRRAGIGPDEPLPCARSLGESSLMFPVHPTLSPRDMHDVCRGVEKVMAAATVDHASIVARAA